MREGERSLRRQSKHVLREPHGTGQVGQCCVAELLSLRVSSQCDQLGKMCWLEWP